jgi:glycosyltransferase 2 family protein
MENDVKKLQIKAVIGIVIVIFVYVIFTIFSDVEKIFSNFSDVMIHSYIIPIVVLFSITLTVRSFIQKQILKQLDIEITFKQSFLIYFSGLSMLITPFGIGQTIKSYFLKKYFNISYAKSVPLVLAERFYDFISIITLLWIATIFVFRDNLFIFTIFSSFLIIIILLVTKSKSFNNFLKQIIIKIPFFSQRISGFDELTNSISQITKLNKISKILPLVFIIITIESIVIHLGITSFQINLTYFDSIQLFYSSLLLGIFSFLPGGVGVTEGIFVNLMVNDGYPIPLASSVIIFLRFITIWSVSILGFIFAFYLLRKQNSI